VVRRGSAVCGDARRFPRGIHNPAPRSTRRAKKVTRCETSRGSRRSRERTIASVSLCALGRRRFRQLAAEPEKRVRVWVRLYNGSHPAGRARNLGGAQPQGGIRLGSWLNPKASVRDPRDEQSPEAAMRRLRRIQPREGHGARKSVRRFGGTKASKGEPHERIRDGISPAGREGSKASKGCESPRTQH